MDENKIAATDEVNEEVTVDAPEAVEDEVAEASAPDEEVEETVEASPEAEEEALVAESASAPASQLYMGALIVGEVEDVIQHGHQYKKFKTANGSEFMVSPVEFEQNVTNE